MNEPMAPPDPLTALSHKLIRAACNDDFDPFMLAGSEDVRGQKSLIRACFYYAVIMTPKTTVVLDNQGRGGMCDMLPEEMVAAWDTPTLLASQGLSFETLVEGAGPGPSGAQVPEPLEILDDLDERPRKVCAAELPLRRGYAQHVSLSHLLKNDLQLLVTVARAMGTTANPELEARSCCVAETTSAGLIGAPVARKLRP